jgi:hypothetical protein
MGNADMIELFWTVVSVYVTVGAIVLVRMWAGRTVAAMRNTPRDRELALISAGWLTLVVCVLAIGAMHGTIGVLVTLAPPAGVEAVSWVETFAREWSRRLSLPMLLGAELVLAGLVTAALIYEWRIGVALRRPAVPTPPQPDPPRGIWTAESHPHRRRDDPPLPRG